MGVAQRVEEAGTTAATVDPVAPARRRTPRVLDLPVPEVAAAAAAVALLVAAGQGMWFLADEWNFLLARRDLSLEVVMRPHNEHWLAFPVLIWRGLVALFGFDGYQPYLLVSLALHTAATAAAWATLRRLGTPRPIALLGALSLLVMGSAAEQLFSAFQLSWTAPALLFLGALWALDRPAPRTWVAATCLLLAMPFGGIAVAFALGIGAALVLAWRPLRALAVAGPALAAYFAWREVWGVAPPIELDALEQAPRWIAIGATGAAAGVARVPAAVAAVLVVGVVVALVTATVRRGNRDHAVVVGWSALFTLAAFHGTIALARASRGGAGQALAGRYLWVGALLLAIAAAAATGPWWPRIGRVGMALACLPLAAALVVHVQQLGPEAEVFRAAKGASAVRILAADRLLADGLAHVPGAQPDAVTAPDVHARDLLDLRADGYRLGYDGRARVTPAIAAEVERRLQTAFTWGEGATADVVVLRADGTVSPTGPGCAEVDVPAGGSLLLAGSAGRIDLDVDAVTVVHVRRGQGPPFAHDLRPLGPTGLELAVPAVARRPSELGIAFPDGGSATLCASSLALPPGAA